MPSPAVAHILRYKVPAVAAVSYSTEAAAFFARISDPGTTRKNLYAAGIDATVAAGVWAKLDALYVRAAADSATALVNLKGATYNSTLVNAPTFTVDQGFFNRGASDFIDTHFNLTTAVSPNYAQDSATIFAWSLTSADSFTLFTDTSSITMHPCFGGQAYVNVNGSGAINGAVANGLGFRLGTRRSSSDVRLYVDGSGTALATGSGASVAAVNNVFQIVGGSSTSSGLDGFGSKLTDGEITALYNAWHPYMQAVAGVA